MKKTISKKFKLTKRNNVKIIKKDNNDKLKKTWSDHALLLADESPNEENIKKDLYIIYWLKEIDNPNKKTLLDAGCGIGQYIKIARNLGFKSEGIDISPTAVEIGKKLKEKIIFGDMRKMPYKNEQFDLVIARGSVEHFPETDLALNEISRVLKKEGILLINVPYKYTIYVLNKKFQQIFGLWKCGYEKAFSINGFTKRLEKRGLKVIELKKSKIVLGNRYPSLVKILIFIDKFCLKLGFGGHHIYFKCVKIK